MIHACVVLVVFCSSPFLLNERVSVFRFKSSWVPRIRKGQSQVGTHLMDPARVHGAKMPIHSLRILSQVAAMLLQLQATVIHPQNRREGWRGSTRG